MSEWALLGLPLGLRGGGLLAEALHVELGAVGTARRVGELYPRRFLPESAQDAAADGVPIPAPSPYVGEIAQPQLYSVLANRGVDDGRRDTVAERVVALQLTESPLDLAAVGLEDLGADALQDLARLLPVALERHGELDLVPHERAGRGEVEHGLRQDFEVGDRDQPATRLVARLVPPHLHQRELEHPDVDHVATNAGHFYAASQRDVALSDEVEPREKRGQVLAQRDGQAGPDETQERADPPQPLEEHDREDDDDRHGDRVGHALAIAMSFLGIGDVAPDLAIHDPVHHVSERDQNDDHDQSPW